LVLKGALVEQQVLPPQLVEQLQLLVATVFILSQLVSRLGALLLLQHLVQAQWSI
jgi:hypothetical protein